MIRLTHNASSTKCQMTFNLYLPPQATLNPLKKVPLLIYLAGLTCTGNNGAEKGFFQYAASREGIAVVYPDTSPRESHFDLIISVPDTLMIFLLICYAVFQKAVSKSKTKIKTGISAQVQVSISMRQKPLGQRDTTCTPILLAIYRKCCSKISNSLMEKESALQDIVWVDTEL